MHVDKKEVLRYLGYRNQYIDSNLNNLIDESIEEIKAYIKPRYTFKMFDVEKYFNGIKLLESNLVLKGKDIKNHLKNSSKCAVFAATLGSVVDSKIRYYERINLTKALVLDACATAYIESFCDFAEKEIEKEANKLNLNITYRYSPGYGDLTIDIQGNILNMLDAYRKIGLTATEDFILIPRKSVTAFIGFQSKSIKRQHPSCRNCNKYSSCIYRKGGSYCGN
ncbi:vitamin B12 dependent methionine synthase, activation domain [Clostridium acetireducens DSM 10703]|uniref:Vitamin B12 dependent methionine synthase, activation domain n=1 Tax=Clostridium acetireducens DSM 10703 TaxID=1121290 RepID=A0A1E8EYJ6_9CLOT|nr:vitamin B12 dependent-methionine synthase activation domain-containing protein [Clostridium acetireducens]OFI06054.1 vitamin B12 dependent methionine synthase, activation domain [Clostridium acetireducens DSM 10703]